MMRTPVRALLATVVIAVITGLIYPLVMTGVAQVAFRHKADGSLVSVNGRVVGSSMIGQAWTARWPQWRPRGPRRCWCARATASRA